MIINIEATVALDKHEVDAAETLLREFVENNRHVTKIELGSVDIQQAGWDGTFLGVERIGMLVKVQAVGKRGAMAIVKLLERLGADGEEPQ